MKTLKNAMARLLLATHIPKKELSGNTNTISLEENDKVENVEVNLPESEGHPLLSNS